MQAKKINNKQLCGITPTQDETEDQALIRLFNHCFMESENTGLVGGGKEPLYKPAGADSEYHQVIFKADYCASALHEVAHWCIAGSQRRLKPDYGYWYSPDGRSKTLQKKFESVEVKPQALEWIFADATPNVVFSISIDNLNGTAFDLPAFKINVYRQALSYLAKGLPARASIFLKALQKYYGRDSKVENLILEQL